MLQSRAKVYMRINLKHREKEVKDSAKKKKCKEAVYLRALVVAPAPAGAVVVSAGTPAMPSEEGA
jgi:hypothetical protein